MFVFRFEDEEERGPWTSGLRSLYCKRWDEFREASNYMDDPSRMPGGRDDHSFGFYEDITDRRFAFTSWAHCEAFIAPHYRRLFRSHGVALFVIEVLDEKVDVGYSGIQCVYRPEDVVSKIKIKR